MALTISTPQTNTHPALAIDATQVAPEDRDVCDILATRLPPAPLRPGQGFCLQVDIHDDHGAIRPGRDVSIWYFSRAGHMKHRPVCRAEADLSRYLGTLRAEIAGLVAQAGPAGRSAPPESVVIFAHGILSLPDAGSGHIRAGFFASSTAEMRRAFEASATEFLREYLASQGARGGDAGDPVVRIAPPA